MPDAIAKELHTLRKWRNLSEHSDPGRWKREGPRREKVVELIESLDARVRDLKWEPSVAVAGPPPPPAARPQCARWCMTR